MPLTSTGCPLRCLPLFPQLVPYPTSTGFFLVHFASTLTAARPSARLSVPMRICRMRCWAWRNSNWKDQKGWRSSRHASIQSRFLRAKWLLTLHWSQSLGWLKPSPRPLPIQTNETGAYGIVSRECNLLRWKTASSRSLREKDLSLEESQMFDVTSSVNLWHEPVYH